MSKSTACRKAHSERISISDNVKDNFQCPQHVSVYFDGKTLTLKGKMKSIRIAVYISGVDAEKVWKLLGIPETPPGTGKAEAETVKTVVMHWHIKQQVINIDFDTTSSNTSNEKGACTFLELWVRRPVLWSACRHHVYELHVHSYTGVQFNKGDTMQCNECNELLCGPLQEASGRVVQSGGGL